MEEAIEMARAKDKKERTAGVERLHQFLESSIKSLSSSEVTLLVDCCLDLMKDTNFRVSQGALQSLDSAAVLSGDHLKIHFNAIVPSVVERLGDGKQPVRDAARRLLLTLMEVSSPTIIVERAGCYAWAHKSWRVREEFARTMASAIALFASTELPLQRAILPSILQMLNDFNHAVREAALLCIEEMYTQLGHQFHDELQRYHLPASMLKDINARLERIEPRNHSLDGLARNHIVIDVKPASLNPKKSSPKAKNSNREVSLLGGDDATGKQIEPVKVYSEKELIREFEKIVSTFVPEKDWSIRIVSLQRLEGLIIGGAANYPCFLGLLKQLIGPLSTQLSDRRSSIVKQACHLLNFLSKELLGDFEACAEMFIPVLFKLVVITVLVIAESADNCIKTMLRNCKVARILPRIVDSGKTDRSAILRAKCCEYALLVLECWADAPEIHRAADLYEALIKCCVGDAMSEVRATARACYRLFAKTWPARSHRLFLSFDPVIQRLINEEDGGIHKRYVSDVHDIELLLTQEVFSRKDSERSLESVLHSSNQKVSAIESMLRGLSPSDKNGTSTFHSASSNLVDPPSSRDPPFPPAVPASDSLPNSTLIQSTKFTMPDIFSIPNGGLVVSDVIYQLQASKDQNKSSYCSGDGTDSLFSFSSYSTRRSYQKIHDRGYTEEVGDSREDRQFMNLHLDRQHMDTTYRDAHFMDSHENYVPNFQKPLSRKHIGGRVTARRRSVEESHLTIREVSNCKEGPTSLIDALSEGLNQSSDWNVRVAAFSFIHSLLQQGPRGVQEVTHNFEKVIKLFFQHLDDPHHKIAQAALSTLADIIQACKKPFESYMERILPHVFPRLLDPKESVRQPSSTILEIVGKTYCTDSLLPALLRSLDEQRSPKAKLAVIDFAILTFNKHIQSSEGSTNSGILKLWLAKLTPLIHDKSTKLKEAAVTCIISVYSHFDSVGVLNFIISLSVNEQNSLRRVVKQYTPRIEVDLMNFLQSKKERQRSKSMYDQSDVMGTSFDNGCVGVSKKSYFQGYSSGSGDSSGNTLQEIQVIDSVGLGASNETQEYLYQNFASGANSEVLISKSMDLNYMVNIENSDTEASYTPRLDLNELERSDHSDIKSVLGLNSQTPLESECTKHAAVKVNSDLDAGLSISQILHLISNGYDGSSIGSKCDALQQLAEASMTNDHSIWTKYFNQILSVVLEVLDDSELSVREQSLTLMREMLKNQKDTMEDSVGLVVEKLLFVTKSDTPKVANEAENCLSIVLSQYDPIRCLSVIVPLLVTEDEKALVTCINCLMKLVGRLNKEELMAQLPSFLPALFDAFGNQSADVRKSVVFCLVDIYIMVGKAFLPYLEGLNSTQLRLVTIYANRISQARTGTPIDAT
ncbi:CLIP-associated protein-like isoform X2 [Impatiens glandulifera]|uniref:CLIP-associated protein-like isoform X2 n=1 Tax=Impatiens glandulifera TaxID=253017 RepID=UPI001FB0FCEE|nr:CLIP-associated protein-like isoform X2 [Impatiens glandulifera]